MQRFGTAGLSCGLLFQFGRFRPSLGQDLDYRHRSSTGWIARRESGAERPRVLDRSVAIEEIFLLDPHFEPPARSPRSRPSWLSIYRVEPLSRAVYSAV